MFSNLPISLYLNDFGFLKVVRQENKCKIIQNDFYAYKSPNFDQNLEVFSAQGEQTFTLNDRNFHISCPILNFFEYFFLHNNDAYLG